MANFKTAAELKISDEEHDGLIHILGVFRRMPPERIPSRDLVTSQSRIIADGTQVETDRLGFNMGYGAGITPGAEPTGDVYHCGTACCIGGHLSLHMQGFNIEGRLFPIAALREADRYVMALDDTPSYPENPLRPLFFPEGGGYYDKIQPKHAVEAMEHFLTTGKDKWYEIYKRDFAHFYEDED